MQKTTLVLVMALLSGCLGRCDLPEIINSTDEWTDKDRTALKTALEGCGRIYKDAPCVKRFEKTPEGQYRVICGAQ
jgi:hypothetical protein